MALPEDFDPSNPQSRSEDYLASALGYWDGELPEPQSRVEIYLKEIAENGTQSGGGILVGTVDETATAMPTNRPDGSSLNNEDYVKPKTSANFPFSIGALTFNNKFTKAIYFNGEWILDAGLIQDTSETPLKNMVQESLDEETPSKNQKEVNVATKAAIVELRKQHAPNMSITLTCTDPSKFKYKSVEYPGSTTIKATYKVEKTVAKIKKIELLKNGVAIQTQTVDIESGGTFEYNVAVSGMTDVRLWLRVTDEYNVAHVSDVSVIRIQCIPEVKIGATGTWTKLDFSETFDYFKEVTVNKDIVAFRISKDFYDDDATRIYACQEGIKYEDYTESFDKQDDGTYITYILKTPCTLAGFGFMICFVK